MIPDLDNPEFIPMPMIRDKNGSRQWDNSLAKSSQHKDHQSPMAWSRLEWLLSAFKANGQKCNMQTIIESTFRGEDLFYTNDTQSQEEYSRPSSCYSSSSTSSSFS